MKRTLKLVPINTVRIDGDTQSRVEMDANWIQKIVDDLKNDMEYDPIETRFDGSHHWLSDGFHRYLAYKQLGVKEINVNYLPGSQFDAQVDSYGANGKHGRARTRADKERSVENAINNPLLKDKSNYEIAKICVVSQPFVASVRDPERKKKQAESVKKHFEKKIQEKQNTNLISSEKPTDRENPYAGEAPSDEEIKSAELALIADQEAMYKLLDSDDALATAHEEIKRLNYLNAQLETRLHGLMNERNEAVKMVKKLQKENDKLKAKK